MKTDGVKVARFTVDRLMKQHGLQRVWRGKNKMTTNSRILRNLEKIFLASPLY